MEHTKHLWRVLFILLLVAVAVVVGRHFVIPPSFGLQGFYRYDSLAEYAAKPVMHGGSASCAACHQDIAQQREQGKHQTVSCEVCHAPLALHAKEGAKTADMPLNRSVGLCAYCHQALKARPATMPQIDLREHLTKLEVITAKDDIPEGACVTCHDVHNPAMEQESPPEGNVSDANAVPATQ
ncbi:MAG: cytochrome C [Candidatus Hydrogenedentes bacterium]|nr:cytochrome C [Candidatus Hydrogenedentota bacterium]